MKGTVELFNEAKGFGFIKPDEGEKHLIVQRGNIIAPSHSLIEGQRVEFEIIQGEKGLEAVKVNIL
ncbi:MAG: hypothetical protein AMS24_02640 [Chlamydiae bacterium SM23_39]|nr:MAG: hypothetical protein AMS24_02640 [Chlamydiae bacterium SM23_39]